LQRFGLPRSPRRPLIIGGVALLLLIACLAGFLLLNKKGGELEQMDLAPGDTYAPFGKGLLHLSGSNLLMHAGAEESTQFAQAFAGGKLLTNARFAAVYSDTQLMVFNNDAKEVLARTYENTTLRAVRLASQYVGTLTTAPDGNSRISWFSATGNFVDEVDLQSKTVLDFGFFGQPASLWVTTIDSAHQTPVSTMEIYASSKSKTFHTQVKGEVILGAYPMKNDIWIIGSSHVYLYDNMTNLLAQTSIAGWQVVGVGAQNTEDPVLLLSPLAAVDENTPSLQALWMLSPQRAKPKIDTRINLPGDATCVVAGESDAFVAAGNHVYAYRYTTGAQRAKCDLAVTPQTFTLAPWAKPGVITTSQNVYRLTLP